MTDDITLSKTNADGRKYFSLFDKYIPDNLSKSANVLLYSISNLDCLVNIINKNPDCNYYICDLNDIFMAVKCFVESSKIYYVKDFEYITENDMKFDCIIMNPPYQRNLHLKILEKAIEQLKDDDSVCVNLSPIRWLQDPLAKYKKRSDYYKFKDSIGKHIETIDNIAALDAQNLFVGAGAATELGVYKCKKTKYAVYTCVLTFIQRVVEWQRNNSFVILEKNKYDGVRVRLPIIASVAAGHTSKPCLESIGAVRYFIDGKKDNKWWFEYYQKNQFTKCTTEMPSSIKFNSETEAINFCKQYDTVFCKIYTHFMKRDVHISPEIILWMHNAINPRTGLKGYESDWTDEDFYTFFNITPDEQKIIEETMKKYK